VVGKIHIRGIFDNGSSVTWLRENSVRRLDPFLGRLGPLGGFSTCSLLVLKLSQLEQKGDQEEDAIYYWLSILESKSIVHPCVSFGSTLERFSNIAYASMVFSRSLLGQRES